LYFVTNDEGKSNNKINILDLRIFISFGKSGLFRVLEIWTNGS